MSQIFKPLTSGGPIPPIIPTEFDTDINSPAIPAANILNVFGNDVSTNNTNGIQTDGSSGSNTLTIQLTNRVYGTVTTVGAVTGDIITFSPTTIGTYAFEFRLAAYNTTSSLGGSSSIFGAIRYDGVNVNICDLFDEISNDEGAMSGTDVLVIASGGSMILQGTGYLGQTINWAAVGLYTFVGI